MCINPIMILEQEENQADAMKDWAIAKVCNYRTKEERQYWNTFWECARDRRQGKVDLFCQSVEMYYSYMISTERM